VKSVQIPQVGDGSQRCNLGEKNTDEIQRFSRLKEEGEYRREFKNSSVVRARKGKGGGTKKNTTARVLGGRARRESRGPKGSVVA